MSEQAIRDFSIGRVVGQVRMVLAAGWPLLLGIAVVLIILPEAAVGWFMTTSGTDEMIAFRISNLLSITVELFAQLMMITVALEHFAGRAMSLGQSLQKATASFFPALGLNILTGLGIILGLILLIVPGIFLAVAWSVALPFRVANGSPAMEAIKGSWALTKGARWPILALYLLLGLATLPLLAAYLVLPEGAPMVGDVVISPLMIAFISLLNAVLSTAIYQELRDRAGATGAETAEVFA